MESKDSNPGCPVIFSKIHAFCFKFLIIDVPMNLYDDIDEISLIHYQ